MKRLALFLLAVGVSATSLGGDDEFTDRLNTFAVAYNAFVEQCHEGRFNIRDAKRLSKLWRRVEDSGVWPKEGKQ
jgi:hypothetical protein